MWIVCVKCNVASKSAPLFGGPGGVFRKCAACDGVALYRAQVRRGRVKVGGTWMEVVEAAGEFQCTARAVATGTSSHSCVGGEAWK